MPYRVGLGQEQLLGRVALGVLAADLGEGGVGVTPLQRVHGRGRGGAEGRRRISKGNHSLTPKVEESKHYLGRIQQLNLT